MSTRIAGFEALEPIYESAKSFVWRARTPRTQERVILKILKESSGAPHDAEMVRYQREYMILRSIDYHGVIGARALLPWNNTCILVVEDFGADSLRYILDHRGPLLLKTVLALGSAIAGHLGAVHDRGIVHRDINPSNIVWNRETDVVKLIDFGIALPAQRQWLEFEHPSQVVGTLPYIAPEQTGRMNRAIDYRADYYSLGITLYELLTGERPFQTTDPLELLHCHLAKTPQPPHLRKSEVPEAISSIVMKLMAKSAEERYQSARALQADLDWCRTRLDTAKELRGFVPGRGDRTRSLKLSEKLYGREAEVGELEAALSRVAAGGRELMLLTGESGIGKSAVVHELYRPLTQHRGFFVSGKYEELQRVPYSGISSAFQGLVRQILTEDEAALSRWRDQVLEAVDKHGQLVIQIIPEVESLIGSQPPVPEVPPAEQRARFERVLRRFVRIFCDASHPLVIFLDDLQWADSSSLALIEVILTDESLQHLLVIGAYRDSELGRTHLTAQALRSMESRGVLRHELSLRALDRDDIATLLGDSLGLRKKRVASMAELVFRKTGGIPFFIRQFLHHLYETGLLRMDAGTGAWHWDEEAIAAEAVTENLVDMLVVRLQQFAPKTREALRLAALLGNRFSLSSLAAALQRPKAEVFAALVPAIDQEVIVPRSTEVQSEPGNLHSPLIIEDLSFAHDRLQQACYSLIDGAERKAAHLHIGRLLHARAETLLAAEEEHRDLFAIAGHFNLAADLIEAPGERLMVAALNVRAGEAALSAQAIDAAASYFALATAELGSEEAWHAHRDLAYRATIGCVHAELGCGRLERARTLLDALLLRAQGRIERAAVYTLLIQVDKQQNYFDQARQHVKEALALFDLILPLGNAGAEIQRLMANIRAAMKGRSYATLARAEATQDPEVEAVLKILDAFCYAALFFDRDLFLLVGLHMVRIALSHGVHGLSAYGFSVLGTALQMAGEYHEAAAAARVGIELAERFVAHGQLATTSVHYAACLCGWVEPMANVVAHCDRGLGASLEAGDLFSAVSNLYTKVHAQLIASTPLPEVADECEETLRYAKMHAGQSAVDAVVGMVAVVANLRGRSQSPSEFSCNGVADTVLIAQWEARGNIFSACMYRIWRGFAHVLYGRDEEALRDLAQAEDLSQHLVGHWASHVLVLAKAVATARTLPARAGAERERARAELAALHDTLCSWARVCPDNFQHHWHLISAERARIDGDWAAASSHYNAAIDHARHHRCWHFEALACERLGSLWLDRGEPEAARLRLAAARSLYQLWGAGWKISEMEREYPFLSTPAPTRARATTNPRLISQNLTSHSLTSSTLDFDIISALKASQFIASRLVLTELLTTLFQVVFESAGAERGTLFVVRDGALVVAAQGTANAQDTIAVRAADTTAVPVDEWGGGPRAVVRYVHRTGNSILIGRAVSDERFGRDPYICCYHPRSILCIPLTHHGHKAGILYLENNMAYDAFTPTGLQILSLIAGQMAISLENARLYHELESALHAARASDRLKSEFLAITSQELKNPLGPILNLPAVMLESIMRVTVATCGQCGAVFELEPDDEATAETPCPKCRTAALAFEREWTTSIPVQDMVPLLQDVIASGRELLASVNAILDISYIESGRVSLQCAALSTEWLVEVALGDIKPLAESRELTIFVDRADHRTGSIEIYADPTRARQLIRHALKHAVGLAGAGDELVLRSHIMPGGAGGYWELEVGRAQLADSEEPTLERTGTGQRQGASSLSLAICEKLCRLHSGELEVHATSSETTLRIHLPLSEAREAASNE